MNNQKPCHQPRSCGIHTHTHAQNPYKFHDYHIALYTQLPQFQKIIFNRTVPMPHTKVVTPLRLPLRLHKYL